MPNSNPKHQSQSNRFADDILNHCKVVRPVIDSLSSRVLLLYLPEIIANYRHHTWNVFHRKIFYFFKTAFPENGFDRNWCFLINMLFITICYWPDKQYNII